MKRYFTGGLALLLALNLALPVNFLFRKIGRRWRVTLDDEVIEDTFALVSMCNGRSYGGGYRCAHGDSNT